MEADQLRAAEEFIGGITGDPGCIVVGEGTEKPEEFRNCIVIGYNASCDLPNSTIIATGPNVFIHPDSNINFAHVMEANSVTKNVTFPGCVVSYTGLYVGEKLEIGELDMCDSCELNPSSAQTSIGFQWDANGHLCNLCLSCVRDATMAFHAKERWNNKNGDPISYLQAKISDLEMKVENLTEALSEMKK